MRTFFLLLLVVACDASPLPDGGTSSGTTEAPASTSTPSSSATESSSTSEGFMTEPDDQPASGAPWGFCKASNDCAPQTPYCLLPDPQYQDWGFCTRECNDISACITPPASAAVLMCDKISPISNTFCLLTCQTSDECPSGMSCLPLPNPNAVANVCS